jgi:hypothetical protein
VWTNGDVYEGQVGDHSQRESFAFYLYSCRALKMPSKPSSTTPDCNMKSQNRKSRILKFVLSGAQWKAGQRHGKGKLTKVNGDGYNGMWIDGKPDMQILKNVHRK